MQDRRRIKQEAANGGVPETLVAGIAAAIDKAVDAAGAAAVEPGAGAPTIADALARLGMAPAEIRALLMAAGHAYERVMRAERRTWEPARRAMALAGYRASPKKTKAA